MPRTSRSPPPMIAATRTPAIDANHGDSHDERMLDEAIDESFPASDPSASASTGSTLALRQQADERVLTRARKPAARARSRTRH